MQSTPSSRPSQGPLTHATGPSNLSGISLLYAGDAVRWAPYEAEHNVGHESVHMAIRTLEGSARLLLERHGQAQWVELTPGTLLLTDDQSIKAVEVKEGMWRHFGVDFMVHDPMMLPWHQVLETELVDGEIERLHQIADSLQSERLNQRRMASSMFYTELYRWLDGAESMSRQEDDGARIDRATSALNSDFSQVMGVEAMAEVAGMSVTAFRKTFRQVTGLSPKVFYDRLRGIHAMGLLSEGLSVKEVAQMVGFNDQSHFSRAYRRVFGFTPRETRRRMCRTTGRAARTSTLVTSTVGN